MKKVKSYRTKRARFAAISLCLAIGAGFTPLSVQAEDEMLASEWFQKKCQPAIAQYNADRPIVLSVEIMDAWTSPMTDQLPWPTAFRSRDAKHACVTLGITYMNQPNPREERFLCSVLDNEMPTEVRMFGNTEIASEICAEPG